jgi:predicted 2-oxoglutarate/Fe(II)-dependent dioxygenase YbiX
MTDVTLLQVGDRVPMLVAGHTDGRMFSLEAQLGRTLVLLLADGVPPERQKLWAEACRRYSAELADAEAEAVVLVSMTVSAMTAHLDPPTEDVVISLPGADLSPLGGQGGDVEIVVIDRAGRIAARLAGSDPDAGLQHAIAVSRPLCLGTGVVRRSAAPVLMVPNLIDRDLCRALIDAFETGPHEAGAMASMDVNGVPVVRHADEKKKRRDLLLEADHPLHPVVFDVLGRRLAPELFRAFQIEIAHADRILLARYDHTGGYFHRHRDNSAPQVAFRQFAVSINLNTGDYTGGELEFPEFGPDLYLPPAGGAAVFSASLLHAARPVLSGTRYVLLTFLHDRAAEERRAGIVSAQG